MISERYTNDGIPAVELNEVQKKYIKEFKKKCDDGIYEKESFKCECGYGGPYELLAKKERFGIDMDTVMCPMCGLVMQNPRMTKESNDLFYENEYPRIYKGVEEPDDKIFQRGIGRGETVLDFIQKWGDRDTDVGQTQVLEIGCSNGGILEVFARAGYKVSGVDLSPEYIEYGRKQGLDLRCCHSKDLLKEGKLYDIIILSHVMEHFTDIKAELEIIKQLLKPETGIFYVAVPSIELAEKIHYYDFLKSLQNAHIYYFTKSTLTQVLAWNGFKTIYATEDGMGLFRIGDSVSDVHNYSAETLKLLKESEGKYAKQYAKRYEHVDHLIAQYKENEILLYGKGKETRRLIERVGKVNSIKGILTNDETSGEYMGYQICDIQNLKGVKCIIIVSQVYRDIIYNRIKHLEKQGIKIEFLFDENADFKNEGEK